MPRSARDIAVVLLLLGAGLFLLFAFSGDRGTGPAAGVAYAIFRPLRIAAHGVRSRAAGLWRGYVDLIGVEEENRLLRNETARLRHDLQVLKTKERENRRLRKLLKLKEHYEFPSLAAQVIGEDATGWYGTFMINRGSDDGVVPGMPATAADGVVGRVVSASASMSKVLLITDPSLSIDCRVARTRDRGVLNGYLDRKCILRYLNLKARIRPGDEVVTSGLGRVFPRGLLLGRVERVAKDAQGLFLEALVTPALDFSEIEEVLVILGRPGGFHIEPGLEGAS
jgi:rod shape-determining protein MreC